MSAPVLKPPARSASAPHPHVPVRQPGLFAAPRRHKFLISQLTRREVIGRYRGSYLGISGRF